jgi:hypothetical protein
MLGDGFNRPWFDTRFRTELRPIGPFWSIETILPLHARLRTGVWSKVGTIRIPALRTILRPLGPGWAFAAILAIVASIAAKVATVLHAISTIGPILRTPLLSTALGPVYLWTYRVGPCVFWTVISSTIIAEAARPVGQAIAITLLAVLAVTVAGIAINPAPVATEPVVCRTLLTVAFALRARGLLPVLDWTFTSLAIGLSLGGRILDEGLRTIRAEVTSRAYIDRRVKFVILVVV